MKIVQPMLLFVAAAALAGPVSEDPPNHVAAGAKAGVAPGQGHRWATDPALRTGMGAIREALSAGLPAIRAGTMRPDEYRALSAAIGARVRTIIAECKLPPAADAELHPILAALIVAANGMQGSQATASAAAAREAVSAVNRYGQIFEDPSWRPLELY